MHLLRCLWFFSAFCEINISASHDPGVLNTAADMLSRNRTVQFLRSHPSASARPMQVPTPLLQIIPPRWLDRTSRPSLDTSTTPSGLSEHIPRIHINLRNCLSYLQLPHTMHIMLIFNTVIVALLCIFVTIACFGNIHSILNIHTLYKIYCLAYSINIFHRSMSVRPPLCTAGYNRLSSVVHHFLTAGLVWLPTLQDTSSFAGGPRFRQFLPQRLPWCCLYHIWLLSTSPTVPKKCTSQLWDTCTSHEASTMSSTSCSHHVSTSPW